VALQATPAENRAWLCSMALLAYEFAPPSNHRRYMFSQQAASRGYCNHQISRAFRVEHMAQTQPQSSNINRIAKKGFRQTARGLRKHHWANVKRHVPAFRRPNTLIDRLCAALDAEDRNNGLSELLGGRVSPEVVRAWRNGRRRPPVWVLSVLGEIARQRARALNALAEECEREIERRRHEPPLVRARGPGGRWLPRPKG
jgi:hypothetical protein